LRQGFVQCGGRSPATENNCEQQDESQTHDSRRDIIGSGRGAAEHDQSESLLVACILMLSRLFDEFLRSPEDGAPENAVVPYTRISPIGHLGQAPRSTLQLRLPMYRETAVSEASRVTF
jgi:hypothetical protein